MLRFQRPNRRRPRNFLARREQYRLFALVVGLGVVLLLMRQLAGTDGAATTDPTAPGSARRLDVDANRAKSNPPAKPGADSAVETGAEGHLIVDRERLARVRDNSHFREGETDAWFYLLSLVESARGNPAVEPVTYAQLVAQPHVYRGQLVRIEGAVKRIEEVTPAENNLGISKLYRVILQPTSRSLWPTMVYCRELPPGWNVGESASNRIAATGFFFKNLSYNSPAGMGIAPVIVSQTFDVKEAPPEKPATDEVPVALTTIIASALAIAGVVVAFVLWRTSTPSGNAGRADDSARVEDALRRLAREGE